MLSKSTVYAMVAVKDLAVARPFYEDVLELEVVDENPAGVTYKSGDSKLFVYPTPAAGTAQSTAATWQVDDIRAVVDWLRSKDVSFEHYDFPGVEYDGDIHIMMGMKAAWFKDPDGNILGLSGSPKK